MKIWILGYGSSGKSAERLAKRLGCEVGIREDGDGRGEKAMRGEAAFAVVSPGVPPASPLIAECRARGIPLKSELQFGCEELKRRGWRLLAVTGSKGKSSVVKVVADAINLAGMHAVPCGNYGLPVSEVALEPEPPSPSYAVVEVSSFMMETTELPADAFEAAAIMNLQEDHLDRHGSVGAYHALKRRLLAMAKSPFDFSPYRSADALRAVGLDAGDGILPGSYFGNEILGVNGAAALFLMRAAGLDREVMRRAFAEFVPLPHRMNVVGEFGGVVCVDDSKATSLAALSAGVTMAARLGNPGVTASRPRIRLVAGGLPKGDDPSSVASVLERLVGKVYLIGRCAEDFAAAWGPHVECEVCGTLERAVASAAREASAGEVLLLSPGTASFDQFRSFGERGDRFARLVAAEMRDRRPS